MISLQPIEYDEVCLESYIYEDGIPKPEHKLLDIHKYFIEYFFEQYYNNIPNTKALKKYNYISKDLPERLYKIYDSTIPKIKELKESIRSVNKTVCGYCGTNDSPYQIDHFYPRKIFPVYSIYSFNLIPSCARCNSQYKGQKYISETGNRLFYNPYFDSFINEIQFLQCNIVCDGIYINVDFVIKKVSDESRKEEFEIIENHFKILHLNERYSTLIIQEIFPEFYNEFVEESISGAFFMNVTLEDLTEAINRRIRGLRGYNKNFWRKVFWEEFKNCEECLKLITEKRIRL